MRARGYGPHFYYFVTFASQHNVGSETQLEDTKLKYLMFFKLFIYKNMLGVYQSSTPTDMHVAILPIHTINLPCQVQL